MANGGVGFHTLSQKDPWWQVDLQAVHPIWIVQVFNRMDCCWDRADTLGIYLSADGNSWQKVYQHSGESFGGKGNKGPLVVDLGGAKARYVRLQLNATNFLHLDEVKIFEPLPLNPFLGNPNIPVPRGY